ncbi:MAG: lytic transglycosylase domain-containing protein [Ghiorsea sp.]
MSLFIFQTPIFAEIYTYKDNNNQFYFTDNRQDSSYQLLSVFRPQLSQQSNNNYSLNAYKRNKISFLPLIRQAASQYHIDPHLLHAIVDVESAFNPNAVSKSGAVGLTQLMPKTAAAMGVKNRKNPEQSIQGGALYFSQLLTRFEFNRKLALAAYNAGPTAVEKAGRKVPNYLETKNYIAKVLKKYQSLK